MLMEDFNDIENLLGDMLDSDDYDKKKDFLFDVLFNKVQLDKYMNINVVNKLDELINLTQSAEFILKHMPFDDANDKLASGLNGYKGIIKSIVLPNQCRYIEYINLIKRLKNPLLKIQSNLAFFQLSNLRDDLDGFMDRCRNAMELSYDEFILDLFKLTEQVNDDELTKQYCKWYQSNSFNKLELTVNDVTLNQKICELLLKTKQVSNLINSDNFDDKITLIKRFPILVGTVENDVLQNDMAHVGLMYHTIMNIKNCLFNKCHSKKFMAQAILRDDVLPSEIVNIAKEGYVSIDFAGKRLIELKHTSGEDCRKLMNLFQLNVGREYKQDFWSNIVEEKDADVVGDCIEKILKSTPREVQRTAINKVIKDGDTTAMVSIIPYLSLDYFDDLYDDEIKEIVSKKIYTGQYNTGLKLDNRNESRDIAELYDLCYKLNNKITEMEFRDFCYEMDVYQSIAKNVSQKSNPLISSEFVNSWAKDLNRYIEHLNKKDNIYNARIKSKENKGEDAQKLRDDLNNIRNDKDTMEQEIKKSKERYKRFIPDENLKEAIGNLASSVIKEGLEQTEASDSKTSTDPNSPQS